MTTKTKVFISPEFTGVDQGDGGIRRVVEAQRRLLPNYNIEVVDQASDADVLAFHAGMWADPRQHQGVVAHCHGLYWEGYEWPRWARLLNKDVIRTMRMADAVTAPSRWVAHAIARGMWIGAKPIYHGVDRDEWTPGVSQGYVVWNKTRVDPICDPTPLTRLAQQFDDVQFKTTYSMNEPAYNVEVVGRLPYEAGKDLVRNAGIYLATSRETFGIGTLEAMACGVPILGWRWGGQAEIVEHKKAGYLAEPGNYEDLANGLNFIIRNRGELGDAARDATTAYQFTWECAAQQYAELYEGVAAEYTARRGNPKVSVVMPCYNLAQYLPAALDSVLESTQQDLEVVVVDDASPDDTRSIVAEYMERDGRVRYIRNEKNLYLAEALNAGVGASLGEYIVPLDADNMVHPEALKTLIDALDNDRSTDIAYGAVEFIRPDGTHFISDWPGQFKFLDQLRHRNQIPSTSMFRRRVWSRIGGYRARCRTAEDADFWCRAASYGFQPKKVTDAVTLVYRDRADSMSHVQADWSWEAWYPWGQQSYLLPFGAAHGTDLEPLIPTHEFPKISVIIPVGPGHERLVLDALDSVQAQSLREWECIVVSDTGTMLLDLPPWAKQWITRGRKGAAVARNAGLRAAKGEYVLFLDADDYLHPRALETMLNTLLAANVDFVYSDWFKQETGEVFTAPEFDCGAVLRQLPFSVTCLYRHDKLQARFDETFQSGWEDWDFTIQVVARDGLCGMRVPAPLLHYRIDSGTLREKAYASRDDLKKIVYAKWEPYITGKVQNMGCGCGAGNRSPFRFDATLSPTGQADPSAGSATLIELTLEGIDSRTYVGRKTGTKYRFGSDPDHNQRFVYNEDVPDLLALGIFNEANSTENLQPLLAVGAP